MVTTNKLTRLLLAALFIAAGLRLAWAADAQRDEMLNLASDKGCSLCHSLESRNANPNQLLPYAPAWKDIARKYRGQTKAEDVLTRVVLGGTGASADGRHWQNKVSDPFMLPNASEINEAEARRLVQWVLSLER